MSLVPPVPWPFVPYRLYPDQYEIYSNRWDDQLKDDLLGMGSCGGGGGGAVSYLEIPM